MTEISFHFNVPEKLGYGCRLLRKAYLSGAQVAVTGDTPQLAELDQLLWTFSATEFIPHSRLVAEAVGTSEVGHSAGVQLMETPSQCPHHEVLVNFGQDLPAGYERFERLIEVVSGEEGDRLAARARWKHYADRGYLLKRHDHSATAAA